jgi:hypothetical protein
MQFSRIGFPVIGERVIFAITWEYAIFLPLSRGLKGIG